MLVDGKYKGEINWSMLTLYEMRRSKLQVIKK